MVPLVMLTYRSTGAGLEDEPSPTKEEELAMVDKKQLEKVKQLALRELGRDAKDLEEEHKEVAKKLKQLDRRLRSAPSQGFPGPSFLVQG